MKIITVLFSLFIILVIILADLGNLPRPLHLLYDFPNGDKAGHFVLFGLLNFLLTLTMLRSFAERAPKALALAIGLMLALLVGLEEFSQRFFAARTSDLIDLSASYLGLLVGGFVALKLYIKQPPL
jgi:VanZ family protein